MRNIDWKAVEERYEDASKVEPPRPLREAGFDAKYMKGGLPAGRR